MTLNAASTIFYTVPLKLLSEEFPTCFWSMRTITRATSSDVVHLALASCVFLLFGRVVTLGEAERGEGWLWVILG